MATFESRIAEGQRFQKKKEKKARKSSRRWFDTRLNIFWWPAMASSSRRRRFLAPQQWVKHWVENKAQISGSIHFLSSVPLFPACSSCFLTTGCFFGRTIWNAFCWNSPLCIVLVELPDGQCWNSKACLHRNSWCGTGWTWFTANVNEKLFW